MEGGVEALPLNYVLQKQLVLEAINSASTTVYCDLCHDGKYEFPLLTLIYRDF